MSEKSVEISCVDPIRILHELCKEIKHREITLHDECAPLYVKAKTLKSINYLQYIIDSIVFRHLEDWALSDKRTPDPEKCKERMFIVTTSEGKVEDRMLFGKIYENTNAERICFYRGDADGGYYIPEVVAWRIYPDAYEG